MAQHIDRFYHIFIEFNQLNNLALMDASDKLLGRASGDGDMELGLVNMRRRPTFDNYDKVYLLGLGPNKNVFKCLDKDTNQTFAMRQLTKGPGRLSEEVTNAIKNEINIMSRLEYNERILEYYGTDDDEESMYIFMEYASQGSLNTKLKKEGPLSLDKIARYSKQLLEGLAFLHGNKIIHRDIKAANILLDDADNLKLCDFGISKHIVTPSGRLGNTDTVTGSPYWMAPEVIRGETYSVGADLWSLGATVVEMLTGHPPFYNMKAFDAMKEIGLNNKVKYTSPTPLSKEFDEFMNKLFMAEPAERGKAVDLLKYDFLSDV